jgi:phage shock protein C
MTMADELMKLQALREQGALTEQEFELAKRRVLGGALSGVNPTDDARQPSALQRMERSLSDRWIGGVCGGLSKATDIPTWAWRILFIMLLLLHGVGLLIYVLMWIFIPIERIKLSMAAPAASVASAAPATPAPAPASTSSAMTPATSDTPPPIPSFSATENDKRGDKPNGSN